MIRILTIMLLLSSSSWLQAVEFDLCNDTVIDAETEDAYGPHGIPYTGEILCYRDKDKKILKSKRAFDNGKPIGKHICFNKDGAKSTYMSYNKTKIRAKGIYTGKRTSNEASWFHPKVECTGGISEECWTVGRECKQGDKYCVFSCR